MTSNKKSRKSFSSKEAKRMISETVHASAKKNLIRVSEDAAVEMELARRGIPRQGIDWRRRHLEEIDDALAKLRWWLDDPKKHKMFTDYDYRESMEHLVKCPICGEMDNDWPIRAGLCLECWCREWNFRYSSKPMIHVSK